MSGRAKHTEDDDVKATLPAEHRTSGGGHHTTVVQHLSCSGSGGATPTV